MLTPSPMSLLLVGSDAAAAARIQRVLAGTHEARLVAESVQGLAALRERLPQGGFDAIVLDLGPTTGHGLAILDVCLALGADAPVVLLAGAGDAPTALEGLRRGAHDAVSRDEVEGGALARALLYAQARDAVRRRLLARTRELEAEVASLTRRSRELEEFGHRLAHDMKAPLRAAVLRLVHVGEALPASLPAQARQDLQDATERLQRLAGTIDDVVIFAAMTGEPAVETDVGAVLADVVVLLDPPAAARVVADVRVAPILTRPLRLRSVLQNLVGNALRHAERPDPEVHVTARDHGDRIVVTVQDNGPGLVGALPARPASGPSGPAPQTLMARPAGRPSGGIGLALTRRLIEAEGGSIHFEAATRGGTMVTFSWPRRPDESRADASGWQAPGLRVAVADGAGATPTP